MAVEVENAGRQARDHGDVSGAVTGALVGLVHAQRGDTGVAQMLALAEDRRTFAELADPERWSSLSEVVALCNAAALVTGDAAVGLHVGEALVDPDDGAHWVGPLLPLGSPEAVLARVGDLVGQIEATVEAAALDAGDGHALVEIVPRRSPTRHAHLCELTRGLLTRIPTLFGFEVAAVSETECSARGGRRCLYELRWGDPGGDRRGAAGSGHEALGGAGDPSSLTEERRGGAGFGFGPGRRRTDRRVGPVAAVEQLQAELDRMDVLVEGALATALELMGDDLDSLLSQIASRADAVVSTLTYLLMVRVRPDGPIQLHYRGMVPEEAQRLAGALWEADEGADGGGATDSGAGHQREVPADGRTGDRAGRAAGGEPSGEPDGQRLVVDIASPRHHYGRLVELLPVGSAPPPFEARVLRHFAEYAATALDVFGVLDQVKRSDATARALLSLSDDLSRVTTVPELVELVVGTVPHVAGCDHCAVLLWDDEAGRLVPGPETGPGDGGSSPPDAGLAPARRTGLPVGTGTGANGHSAAVPVGTHPGDGTAAPEDTRPELVPSRATIDRLLEGREVLTVGPTSGDPALAALPALAGSSAAAVAPLVAVGELLGVIVAGFGPDAPDDRIGDGGLHDRLTALADQTAAALQNLNLLEQVSHMAWHDVLTGLPNRRLFEDRVDQELVRSRRVGEPVCMFFVDLDHFKTVNDTFGHSAGDDLIRQVGDRLVDTVRRQDTVARVGGDEFAILLPGLADQRAIEQLAERALEVLTEPFVILGEEMASSASIGIAVAPDHGDTYDELLSRADEAMYRAKASGRNAFQMYAGPSAAVVPVADHGDDRSLANDLSHALERDEFFVVYQPYIDLRTSEVAGVEALVRWQHPSFGVLEPGAFIALAERSDVIVALDTWVLDQACQQVRAWLDAGLPALRLSVNLASRDLSSPGLVARVRESLAVAGLDPATLELEITERVVVTDDSPARRNIDELRRLGVRFTIDDFGRGNSSLSRIGSFPVSTLKIDQSFVQVLAPDGDSDALVSAIITMADRLGLECVAEGVETALQSRILLQRGCTTAQGYYFSPPLDPGQVADLLTAIDGTGTVPVLDEIPG